MSGSQDQSFYTPKNLEAVVNDIKEKLLRLSGVVFVNGVINSSKEIEEERREFFALNKELRRFEDILKGVRRQIRQDSKDPVKRKEFFKRQNEEHREKFYARYYDNFQKKIEHFNTEHKTR